MAFQISPGVNVSEVDLTTVVPSVLTTAGAFAGNFVWGPVNKIKQIGVKIISLADTVGVASPDQIYRVIQFLVNQLPDIEIGAHLHSTQINWQEKLDAALSAGCRRIDGAIKGIGGCPMAGNELVGNMNTEFMLSHIDATLLSQPINQKAFQASVELANQIFI